MPLINGGMDKKILLNRTPPERKPVIYRNAQHGCIIMLQTPKDKPHIYPCRSTKTQAE